jgi:hypothetical protein
LLACRRGTRTSISPLFLAKSFDASVEIGEKICGPHARIHFVLTEADATVRHQMLKKLHDVSA